LTGTGAILEVSKSLSELKDQPLTAKCTKSEETRRFSISARVLDVLREHKKEQDQHRAIYGDRNLVFARPDGEYHR
jgi:hypothetical protein